MDNMLNENGELDLEQLQENLQAQATERDNEVNDIMKYLFGTPDEEI